MAEEDFKALKSMAIASAAKLGAAKFGHLPTPPPKAVPDPRDVQAISMQVSQDDDNHRAKRQRREDCGAHLMTKAWEELVRTEGKEPLMCEMTIPIEFAGLVIGKQGSGIKAIERDCGVVVQIKPSPEENKKLCTMIGGSEKCLERARRIIERIIDTAKEKTANEQVEEVLEVPERFIGMLVGPKGEFLKRVKDNTGCRCDIDKTEPVGAKWDNRKIKLSGSFRAVHMGRDQLELQILQCYRKAKVFNAQLEEKFKGADERPDGVSLPNAPGYIGPGASAFEGSHLKPASAPEPPVSATSTLTTVHPEVPGTTAASQQRKAISDMQACTQVPLAFAPEQEVFEHAKKWACFLCARFCMRLVLHVASQRRS